MTGVTISIRQPITNSADRTDGLRPRARHCARTSITADVAVGCGRRKVCAAPAAHVRLASAAAFQHGIPMLAALGVVFPVFALILIGWAAGRRGILPADAVGVLNGFVVRLALPVLMFQFVAQADWPALWHPGFVAAMAGGIAIVFAGTMLIGPAGRGMTERSVESLAASYANTAFMGIPIGQALFGQAGVAAAVIASLLTVCLLFAFSILLIEIDRHRGRGAAPAVRGVLLSLVRNPIVVGPVAGGMWALTGAVLPEPIDRIASLLGAAASPVALVTIGLFLAAAPQGPVTARAAPLIAAKLVAQPLATFALAWLLGVPAPWAGLATLIAALPTGTGPFMLAKLYESEAAVIARVILATTILAAVTIPLLAVLIA
ncbi:MAG: transporter [Sphingomonas bacterium]|nr:transporter [Sphingomonas bacterium]